MHLQPVAVRLGADLPGGEPDPPGSLWDLHTQRSALSSLPPEGRQWRPQGSDLTGAHRGRDARPEVPAESPDPPRREGRDADPVLRPGPPDQVRDGMDEIGRASCRESAEVEGVEV